MTYFAELGRALRIFRDRAKLTGAEVAERAEMGKAQLSKYEIGAELPNLRTLAKLLDALEIEPLWFFYLMHQLSHGQSLEALKADLLRSDAGPLFSAGEPEAFRRLLESTFELHAAVIAGRLPRPSWRFERARRPKRSWRCLQPCRTSSGSSLPDGQSGKFASSGEISNNEFCFRAQSTRQASQSAPYTPVSREKTHQVVPSHGTGTS